VLIVLITLDDIIDGDNQVALDLELDEGEGVVLTDKVVSAFKLKNTEQSCESEKHSKRYLTLNHPDTLRTDGNV
jgi:hypothetical protein